jgi:hypothetical protein
VLSGFTVKWRNGIWISKSKLPIGNRLPTAPEGNGVRMIYRKRIMRGLVAVFSVLLFVDRAPDGGVSETAVDEARGIALIARNANSGAPRKVPRN